MKRLLRLIFVFLVLGLTWAAPVAAQPPAGEQASKDTTVRAAELKKQGDHFMATLDFGKALDRYDEALRLTNDPVFLYNSGRALQGLNRYPEALDRLEKFRDTAPPKLLARVPTLDELISSVAANVATVKVTANLRGSRVLIRGKDVGVTPLTLRVTSGDAKIEVLKDGYVAEAKSLDLAGATETEVTFELIATESTLKVEVPGLATAVVKVDGKELGHAPISTTLSPGEHELEVSHPEYETVEKLVVVKKGRVTVETITMEEIPEVYETWWFWTILGAVVAGGAATGIAIAATTERSPDEGDVDPGFVSAPIMAAPRRPAISAGGVAVHLWLPAISF